MLSLLLRSVESFKFQIATSHFITVIPAKLVLAKAGSGNPDANFYLPQADYLRRFHNKNVFWIHRNSIPDLSELILEFV